LGTEGGVAAPIDRAIWFGPFCLRPAAHLLLEADTPVHIGVRALDLLIVLVERAGEVVTKEELFARVWPGLTVEEGNLKTQVALVRKTLRDGQAGARYLMTVPGRGYSSRPFQLQRHQNLSSHKFLPSNLRLVCRSALHG
jgi:DNA-binding winged helix-turn-helix (wHTH) protein